MSTPAYLVRRLEQAIERQPLLAVPRTWPLEKKANRALQNLGLSGRVDVDQPWSVRRAIDLIEGEET